MTAGHVFISHGSENRREAEEISTFIEGHGIRTWIAPRDVRPGMDYSEQLQSAIEQCLAFVVLVTETANSSPYVRAETEMAFSNNKPIFPVRQSEIMPAAGLAFFLKIRHWTDAYGANAEAGMERLALELRALAGLSAETAAPITPAQASAAAAPSYLASPPPPAPPAAAVDPASAPMAKAGLPRSTLFVMAGAGLLIVLVVVALALGQKSAPPAPGPLPAPAPSPGPMPQPSPDPAPTPTTGIDRNLLIGRWTDNGDCAQAVDFTADGRAVAPNGQSASWELNGDQLLLTAPDGQQRTIRITSVDQSAIYGINPDGSVESSTRC